MKPETRSEAQNRITLVSVHEAYKAISTIWAESIKPALLSGKRLVLSVRESDRTLEQNAKFHALCGDIAKSGAQWMGKRRSAKQWKVLMVSGHAIATGEEVEMIVGLEGEVINIRESTALMSIRRSSSLIEYTLAWCAQNEIRLPVQEFEHA